MDYDVYLKWSLHIQNIEMNTSEENYSGFFSGTLTYTHTIPDSFSRLLARFHFEAFKWGT